MASFAGRCPAANNVREDEVSLRMERMQRCDWSMDASNQNKPGASGRVSPGGASQGPSTLKLTHTRSHLMLHQERGDRPSRLQLRTFVAQPTDCPLIRDTIFCDLFVQVFFFFFLLSSLALTESQGHFRTVDLNGTARQKSKSKVTRKPAEEKESRRKDVHRH